MEQPRTTNDVFAGIIVLAGQYAGFSALLYELLQQQPSHVHVLFEESDHHLSTMLWTRFKRDFNGVATETYWSQGPPCIDQLTEAIRHRFIRTKCTHWWMLSSRYVPHRACLETLRGSQLAAAVPAAATGTTRPVAGQYRDGTYVQLEQLTPGGSTNLHRGSLVGALIARDYFGRAPWIRRVWKDLTLVHDAFMTRVDPVGAVHYLERVNGTVLARSKAVELRDIPGLWAPASSNCVQNREVLQPPEPTRISGVYSVPPEPDSPGRQVLSLYRGDQAPGRVFLETILQLDGSPAWVSNND